ncbi:MAG TPA: SAM-dependent methyltransferase [Bacillales bacterium]|nr:SAM-dependent methyltransferase [Bacillales bacterium]
MENILRNLMAAAQDHCITYEQFMNTVLYHPEKGYYHRPVDKVGKKGDFYTSPTVHPVFGRTLARFFIDLINSEELPPVVCEWGAGDGRLAAAVLEEWGRLSPDTYKDLTYIMVEDSPYLRQEQLKYLPSSRPVVQYCDWGELREEYPAFCGILFSNELFDAFPVRVVENVEGVLHEVKVGVNEGGDLEEVRVPCVDRKIFQWLEAYGFPLKAGQRIEIPLMMTNWLKTTTNWISRGALLTIDYGFTEMEWREPLRKNGSLRGYYRHYKVDNPLVHPGEMDLTAHIHVDAVRKIMEEGGLAHIFTLSQKDFLLRAGIFDYLNETKVSDPFSPVHRQNRAVNTLVSESSMGNAFRALLQGKGLTGQFAKACGADQTAIHGEIQKRR